MIFCRVLSDLPDSEIIGAIHSCPHELSSFTPPVPANYGHIPHLFRTSPIDGSVNVAAFRPFRIKCPLRYDPQCSDSSRSGTAYRPYIRKITSLKIGVTELAYPGSIRNAPLSIVKVKCSMSPGSLLASNDD